MAHTSSRLRALALCMTALLGAACLLTSCEETTEQWDPYENWQVRNIAWFASVADSARTAISQAKAQYGDEWEKHCEWRMYKTLQRSASTRGPSPTVSAAASCSAAPGRRLRPLPTAYVSASVAG